MGFLGKGMVEGFFGKGVLGEGRKGKNFGGGGRIDPPGSTLSQKVVFLSTDNFKREIFHL